MEDETLATQKRLLVRVNTIVFEAKELAREMQNDISYEEKDREKKFLEVNYDN